MHFEKTSGPRVHIHRRGFEEQVHFEEQKPRSIEEPRRSSGEAEPPRYVLGGPAGNQNQNHHGRSGETRKRIPKNDGPRFWRDEFLRDWGQQGEEDLEGRPVAVPLTEAEDRHRSRGYIPVREDSRGYIPLTVALARLERGSSSEVGVEAGHHDSSSMVHQAAEEMDFCEDDDEPTTSPSTDRVQAEPVPLRETLVRSQDRRSTIPLREALVRQGLVASPPATVASSSATPLPRKWEWKFSSYNFSTI